MPVGGWRGHPNSLAALKAGWVHRDFQRHCTRCNRIACKNSRFCFHHGGGVYRTRAGRGERSALRFLDRVGLLPLDLIALPVWRGLSAVATSTRSPLRLAMVKAWDSREIEPLAWAAVHRRAMAVLASDPGRRGKTYWLDNN
jgi:hypothetical protein